MILIRQQKLYLLFDDNAAGTTVNYNGTSSTQKGAVSVGDGKLVRQIQNVGAGRITAESTDAVMVASYIKLIIMQALIFKTMVQKHHVLIPMAK